MSTNKTTRKVSLSTSNIINDTSLSRRDLLLGASACLCSYACTNVLPPEEVPLLSLADVKKAIEAGNDFIHNKILRVYVFLKKTDGIRVQAMSLVCTHQGCAVKDTGAEFHCPCHGAKFSREGAVLQGPATIALPYFKLSEKDGTIFFHRRSFVTKDWHLLLNA